MKLTASEERELGNLWGIYNHSKIKGMSKEDKKRFYELQDKLWEGAAKVNEPGSTYQEIAFRQMHEDHRKMNKFYAKEANHLLKEINDLTQNKTI